MEAEGKGRRAGAGLVTLARLRDPRWATEGGPGKRGGFKGLSTLSLILQTSLVAFFLEMETVALSGKASGLGRGDLGLQHRPTV